MTNEELLKAYFNDEQAEYNGTIYRVSEIRYAKNHGRHQVYAGLIEDRDGVKSILYAPVERCKSTG